MMNKFHIQILDMLIRLASVLAAGGRPGRCECVDTALPCPAGRVQSGRAHTRVYFIVTTAVQLDTVSVRYDYQNFKITGLTLAPS